MLSIVVMMTALGWAIFTTVYVGLGLDDGTLGLVLGVALSLVLLGQVWGRLMRRGTPAVERMLEEPLPSEALLLPAANYCGTLYNRPPSSYHAYSEHRCEPGTETVRLPAPDPVTEVIMRPGDTTVGIWPPPRPSTIRRRLGGSDR